MLRTVSLIVGAYIGLNIAILSHQWISIFHAMSLEGRGPLAR